MMKTKSIFMGLMTVLLLAGCASDPAYHAPGLTYANLAPVALNVAQVEIRDDYKPPMAAPNVEHTFQTPLYVATENLLKKQLVASGHDNILRAVIQEASVVEEPIPVENGFMGFFKKEQSAALKARVVVRFELASAQAPDIIISNMTLTAKRTKTLLEGASINEHDQAAFRLTEELMNDLNSGLATQVRGTFGKM